METFTLLTIVKNVDWWIGAVVIVNGAMAHVFLGVSFWRFRCSEQVIMYQCEWKLIFLSGKAAVKEALQSIFRFFV